MIGLTHENHQKAKKFKEEEKRRKEKMTNKVLIGKLLEINEGKLSVSKPDEYAKSTIG